ncbi:MAG: iron-sulfur cluster assembly accessory protein [Acidobacteria bacterium]|nr:iron-sulfur cluster assembly accessory protein [Acidobacteriota bacterium]
MITVSEKALTKLKDVIKAQGKEVGLRVRVLGGGCSGLQYQMQFDENPAPGDKVYEFDGVKVFVDLKSGLYLAGSQLDYEDGLMGKGFRFMNPNAKGTCGCGESFTV